MVSRRQRTAVERLCGRSKSASAVYPRSGTGTLELLMIEYLTAGVLAAGALLGGASDLVEIAAERRLKKAEVCLLSKIREILESRVSG